MSMPLKISYGLFPGLTDRAEWLWNFAFLFSSSSPLHWDSPPFFSPFLLTLSQVFCWHLSFLLVLMSTLFQNQRLGGHTLMRQAGAKLLLQYWALEHLQKRASAKHCWSVFCSLTYFLVPYFLLCFCTCSYCHLRLKSWEPWSMACTEAHSLAYNIFGLTRKFLPTQYFFCLSIWQKLTTQSIS